MFEGRLSRDWRVEVMGGCTSVSDKDLLLELQRRIERGSICVDEHGMALGTEWVIRVGLYDAAEDRSTSIRITMV